MALSVVLVEPQIPPNTGNIARLCAATDSPLHLVEPMGFDLHDQQLNRAGLDYWNDVDLWVHPGWRYFRSAVARERCLYFSTHATQSYLDAPYERNSVLVFGNETSGLPERVREKHADRLYRIPMLHAVRSLNLATAVAVVLYEGTRRLEVDLDSSETFNQSAGHAGKHGVQQLEEIGQ
jgi:tRNA (cytidine/uridine-2'-O-)-methyltransferase